MQRVTKRFAIVVALTVMVALWGVYSPMDARGQIKQLTIGIGIDADTLNPQEQTTTLIQNMCALLYDTYLYQTPEGKLEPRLVTKYEVSPDGLNWTLHLRKGVKFSDGTPFNAKAVKLSFDRTLDPKCCGSRSVLPLPA
jgi:ABC-type transport system substrate-binding protein